MSKILLKNVRLAFPALFTPKAFSEGQEPKYQATFLIAKSDKELVQQIVNAERALMREKWPEKSGEDGFAKRLRRVITDGDEKSHLDGYDDTVFFINASSKARPSVFDRNRSPLTENDGVIFAGDYVNAIVHFWAQDNQYGKAINAELGGVQWVSKGERFGGGAGAAKADEFPDFLDEPADEPAGEPSNDDDPLGL